MRYLILSDIHSNLTALDACLKTAEGRWDKAACLGDVVGYGPDPNEVIDRVRSIGALTIRGNHDKATSGVANAEDFNPIARAAALWTRKQLRPENQEWLENLPQGPVAMDGFHLVHGAVHDEDEYLLAPAQALDSLADAPSPVTFFGHTHIQGGFSLHEDKVSMLPIKPSCENQPQTLELEPGAIYMLNPGSVGQPRDGDNRAAFVLADLPNNSVEFWRVPYNIEAVQKRMEANGLPEPLILRLSFGR
ncbi:MAG TPA: metallophosphoesterase family protein [Candidatus Acidoferrales bacterium]|nr:metallophosphoesterase family protein [Candidatus Acidoferrales bacterium]